MRRFILFSFILLIIPLQLVYLFVKKDNSSQNNVAGIKIVAPMEVLNWVGIGEYRFTLFGYTSPEAEVYFNGQGIFDQTVSQKNGYFEFENRFSPFASREACLSSKDQFGRISSPVCLPPFPVKYNVSIGPVLIPPTVSLNKGIYYIDDEVILSGQTIPNSEVNLSVFTKEGKLFSTKPNDKNSRQARMVKDYSSSEPRQGRDKLRESRSFALIKPVEAFSFPDLTARSDSSGNFSLSLPSGSPESFRLFAQTDFDSQESGESVKLNFQVYPIWMIIVRFFLFIIAAIKSRVLEIIILGELIYLVLFMSKMIEKKNRAIILRQAQDDMIVMVSQFTLSKVEGNHDLAVYKEPQKLVIPTE